MRKSLERGLGTGAFTLEMRDASGYTPLHYAVQQPHNAEIVSELLQNGANPNAKTKLGRTPLHLAVGSRIPADGFVFRALRCEAVVRELLKWGADATAADSLGKTPLHLATVNGLSGCFNILADAGGDPLAVDRTGKQPLHAIVKPCQADQVGRRLDPPVQAVHPQVLMKRALEELEGRGPEKPKRRSWEVTPMTSIATSGSVGASASMLSSAGSSVVRNLYQASVSTYAEEEASQSVIRLEE